MKKDDVVGFFAKTGFLDVLHIVESERTGAKTKNIGQSFTEKDNVLESFLSANRDSKTHDDKDSDRSALLNQDDEKKRTAHLTF